ncbi:hypothetical protein AZE42_04483 [Rhizopogon vesiculosus]|uniref:Enoyl-CoA hydratase n=1 Tax=Rhizopogon vesiculosus TaxID=180088 RepID=A0A1J8PY20_9AGAM|nr:hypothetical protein AZE42_04483 [Rhizopogon vesiculosus]
MTSKFINISSPSSHALLLELNRKLVNAFSTEIWKEYGHTFDELSTHHEDIHAVVLSSAFPNTFNAGLDFNGIGVSFDPARRAVLTCDFLLDLQHAMTAPERCPFPVIAAIHGSVIGMGVDLIVACDEVDMGLAADVGTLAHLPKITGNQSLARELAYTARTFSSDEALKLGLVSRVVEGGREAVVGVALHLARVIASKSPIAVSGTKHLLHARGHR